MDTNWKTSTSYTLGNLKYSSPKEPLICFLGCDLMVHYGHSCLVPIDRTAGIKMLYVFVDIKIDSLHFMQTVKFNFDDRGE